MGDQMSFDWDIGVSMLTAYDADGFLSAQVNAEGEQQSGVHPYQLHHMGGFAYRQLDPVIDENGEPDPTQSAQLLFAMEGGQAHAWCLEDPRSVAKLPQLKKGEAVMYGAQGNFFKTDQDGSLSMSTSDDGTGTATGNAIFFRVRPNEFRRHAPWGTESFGYEGFHLRCKGGARIDAGFLGGMPAPLDALTSYVAIEAATISLKCSVLKIGPPGPTFSMALAPAVAARDLAIIGALEAILATLTSITTVGAIPSALLVPPVTAAVEALLATSGEVLTEAVATKCFQGS